MFALSRSDHRRAFEPPSVTRCKERRSSSMVSRRPNHPHQTALTRSHLRRHHLLYLLIVVGTLFATANPVLGQDPEGLQDALDILDAWTSNRVLNRGIPGLSIGIVVGDKLVWARGYGYADLEKKIPATPQTLYGIRSITKTFTAVAILQLRDAGKLQLEDPLTHHLTQVHILKHSANSPDITIRELLTHTSGLQQDPP